MAASAPVAVCCPNCWRWSELKNASTCKRCGAPLVLPDGRRVDEARSGTAPAPVSINAPTVSLASPMVGTDWVAIARWITVAHGALVVLFIFAIGLIVPTITVPVQDPSTGGIVEQTVNIRPGLAIVAVLVMIFYAGFVKAIGWAVVRVILLILVLIGAFAAASRIGTEPLALVAGTITGLIIDAGFAYVLTMTFLAPRRPAPVAARAPVPIAALPLAPPPPPPPPAPSPWSPPEL
jgi:hypothetical protein